MLQAADEENRKIIEVPKVVVVGLWKSIFMGILDILSVIPSDMFNKIHQKMHEKSERNV